MSLNSIVYLRSFATNLTIILTKLISIYILYIQFWHSTRDNVCLLYRFRASLLCVILVFFGYSYAINVPMFWYYYLFYYTHEVFYQEGRGHWTGNNTSWYPKFYKFVGLKTLNSFLKSLLAVSKCTNFSVNIFF